MTDLLNILKEYTGFICLCLGIQIFWTYIWYHLGWFVGHKEARMACFKKLGITP